MIGSCNRNVASFGDLPSMAPAHKMVETDGKARYPRSSQRLYFRLRRSLQYLSLAFPGSFCLAHHFLIKMHESEGASHACNFICRLRRWTGPKDERTGANDTYQGMISVWRWFRSSLREPCAEFLGTLVIVLFLEGVVAQITISDRKNGSYLSISIVTGIAVMLGMLIAGPVSGAHLNPAITLAFVAFGRFPLRKAPGFIISQLLGGFTGAALVYANYRSGIDFIEGHNIRTHTTAIIFSTYPQPYLTKLGQLFSEFLATALLSMGIFSISNTGHAQVIRDLAPLWVFLLILCIGGALGLETGYAMNMARDFAPRCFAYFAGYGPEVWTYGDYYWWVPVVAPFLGALFGGLVYKAFVYDDDLSVK
ncbi:Aquaglyceroporin-9 [Exophiala dermatitidis]